MTGDSDDLRQSAQDICANLLAERVFVAAMRFAPGLRPR
jgi:hypothetical protein